MARLYLSAKDSLMPLTIRQSDLHVFDGETDLGHVVDAVRNDALTAADAKAALDVAWLALLAQVPTPQ